MTLTSPTGASLGAPSAARARFDEILQRRILVIDGAMGTMMQKKGLTEDDYRGTRFASADGPLNFSPAASTISTKSGFSDRKP